MMKCSSDIPIERALNIAYDAHRGQKDKGGHMYIQHPIRVMHKVNGDKEKKAAVLHDTVEDSNVTISDLEKCFSSEVVEAVRCLTRKESESYMDFVERVKTNEIARKVKIYDIRDNLDLSRLDEIRDEDIERVRKYKKALEKLEDN